MPVTRIRTFAPTMSVISSKQRPRKLTMHGSDGTQHAFLLKGHEDLRQDERVMQLFGLVNTLLSTDRDTQRKDLAIQRYSVVPLSPNSGLISWVAQCDTLHSLIKEYREPRKVLLNIEHRLMLQMAPDYDTLPVLQKLEVFQHTLANSTGSDIARALAALAQRRALADAPHDVHALARRHVDGRLHPRPRRPPPVQPDARPPHRQDPPHRLWRLLRGRHPPRQVPRDGALPADADARAAMEVSGIEGNYRSTCEAVMGMLRNNKDSVLAMLEAFVHDPLINWRLLARADAAEDDAAKGGSFEKRGARVISSGAGGTRRAVRASPTARACAAAP